MSARMNTDIAKFGNKSIFRKFGAGKFSIRTKFSSHIAQNILSDFEKEHGMALLHGSALKFIPESKEADWLEALPSKIPSNSLLIFYFVNYFLLKMRDWGFLRKSLCKMGLFSVNTAESSKIIPEEILICILMGFLSQCPMDPLK